MPTKKVTISMPQTLYDKLIKAQMRHIKNTAKPCSFSSVLVANLERGLNA
jgi:hypothetical protein